MSEPVFPPSPASGDADATPGVEPRVTVLQTRVTRRRALAWLGGAGSMVAMGLLAACSGPDETGEAKAALRERAEPTPSPSVFPPHATASGTASSDADGDGDGDEPSGDAEAGGSATAEVDGQPGGVATATTGRRITIAIDPFIAAALQPQVTALRERLVSQLSARAVENVADADVVLGTDSGGEDDLPGITSVYAAVVSRRLLVRDVTWGDLQGAWNGEIGDWSMLGSPVPHGVVPVTLQGSAGQLDPARAVGDLGSVDDLASYLHGERGGLAFVPVDAVDYRFRTLSIDGVTPFRIGDADYPLRVRIVARASAGTPDGVLEQVRQVFAAAG